ncbi:hypothetical protein AB0H71_18595 [Nocardia sp. NPDC050697]|uniref:hypothetical protein n=1 Tax=Nocardia sp. NPDC050697 TaxID=3155158 RepID=UPI00340B3F42
MWTVRRAHRADGVITETGTEILTLPDGRFPVAWVRGRVGRDGTLWLHEDGNPRRWYRYEL